MVKLTANRRGVLIGGVASLAALSLRVPRLSAADPIRVRPDASTAEGKAMLIVYAKAVAAMKQKPAHEPMSWWFQANLHWMPFRGPGNDPKWGTREPADIDAIFAAPASSDQATRDRLAKLRKLALDSTQGASSPFGPNRAWVTCPHHTPPFVVWHRIYLALFEQAVERVAYETGALPAADRFALPYWNYLVNKELPEPFRIPGNSSNPLFVAFRTPRANSGSRIIDRLTLDGTGTAAPGGWPVASQKRTLLGVRQFSDVLESAPHDTVHGAVGSGGWMGGIDRAARDPVFWLHHAQIDRLWESWRKSENGADPSDSTPAGKAWNDALFRFVSLSDEADAREARAVIDTGVLGYRYDKLEEVPTVMAAGPTTEPSPEAAGAPIAAAAAAVTVGAATVRVPLVAAEGAPAGAEPLSHAPGVLTLRMGDISAAIDPGTDYDIFVQPKGASGEPSGEPVARINLFGRVHDMPDHEAPGARPAPEGVTVSIPLTESLAAAGVSELRPEDLVVTIRPNASPAGDIIIQRIELVVQ